MAYDSNTIPRQYILCCMDSVAFYGSSAKFRRMKSIWDFRHDIWCCLSTLYAVRMCSKHLMRLVNTSVYALGWISMRFYKWHLNEMMCHSAFWFHLLKPPIHYKSSLTTAETIKSAMITNWHTNSRFPITFLTSNSHFFFSSCNFKFYWIEYWHRIFMFAFFVLPSLN